jgi:hypothetical protein
MNNLTKILVLVLALSLFSCASGPKYSAVKESFPQLMPEEGRIFFYRTGNMFGSGMQPVVILNGEKVGKAIPGGFFFVDRPPGDNQVLLKAEVERKLSFTLVKGQKRYVRISVGLVDLIFRIYPILVEELEALQEMEGLSYTGAEIKTK